MNDQSELKPLVAANAKNVREMASSILQKALEDKVKLVKQEQAVKSSPLNK